MAANLVERCALPLFVRGERRPLISPLRLLLTEQVEQRFMLCMWMRVYSSTCASSTRARTAWTR